MVWSMARTGNTLYVGGDFDHFGFPSGSAVLVDSVTGSSLGFPKIDGTIYTVLPDDAGGWYIGGNFSKVGGLARSGLAHVRSDFSVAPWDPHPTNGAGYASIYALVRSGRDLLRRRELLEHRGQARTGFAAVDTTTGTATSLSANTNGAVRAIAVTPGAVFVGGEFTTISGFSRPYLARDQPRHERPDRLEPGAQRFRGFIAVGRSEAVCRRRFQPDRLCGSQPARRGGYRYRPPDTMEPADRSESRRSSCTMAASTPEASRWTRGRSRPSIPRPARPRTGA